MNRVINLVRPSKMNPTRDLPGLTRLVNCNRVSARKPRNSGHFEAEVAFFWRFQARQEGRSSIPAPKATALHHAPGRVARAASRQGRRFFACMLTTYMRRPCSYLSSIEETGFAGRDCACARSQRKTQTAAAQDEEHARQCDLARALRTANEHITAKGEVPRRAPARERRLPSRWKKSGASLSIFNSKGFVFP
jgi:hypothetical protein